MMPLMETLHSLLAILGYLVPLSLLATALPRRTGFAWRATASVAIFALYFQFTWFFGRDLVFSDGGSLPSLLLQVAFFSTYLFLMAGMVALCFECNAWAALFCASAAYTAQNISAGMHNFIGYCLGTGAEVPGSDPSATSLAVSVVVILGFYLLFARPIRRQGLTLVENRSVLLLLGAVIFFNIAFDMASKSLVGYDVPLTYVLVISLAHLGVCLLVLYLEYELLFNRRLQIEAAATNRLMSDRERQYQVSRETIDAINMKCHDIRHQIRHFPGSGASVDPAILADIAREVDVYDSRVQTGNEGMDTILSEKRLYCEGKGVELDCVADGSALGFLSNSELYSLFGNLLDNAIEAVERLDDPAKRIVSLNVRAAAGMATIHEENYFDGVARIRDGLPISTKGDPLNHGYGFRSMRAIVESHGGAITCGVTDHVFFVDAVIPQIPQPE